QLENKQIIERGEVEKYLVQKLGTPNNQLSSNCLQELTKKIISYYTETQPQHYSIYSLVGSLTSPEQIIEKQFKEGKRMGQTYYVLKIFNSNKKVGEGSNGEREVGWLVDCKALFLKKAYRPTDPPIFSLPRWPSACLYTPNPTNSKLFANRSFPNIWEESSLSAEKRKHPHQKPKGLIKALIEATTAEGDLIIDPCAGSFVVLDACQELKREFIGCDLTFKELQEFQQERTTKREFFFRKARGKIARGTVFSEIVYEEAIPIDQEILPREQWKLKDFIE
ncbi:35689_t:CDS:2, partial [Racocetra persica]